MGGAVTAPLPAPRFLPWLRSGLATQITTPAVGGLAPSDTASAAVGVQIRVTGADAETVEEVDGRELRLRGPGDVIAIDAAQFVRHDPEPGATDAEPAYFALVELAAADLPWRFTPAAPGAAGKLQPWIALVVVEERDGVALADGGARLPVLTVDDPSAELPDLDQCWAWAHVHADHDLAEGVAEALRSQPDAFRARLLCPRRVTAGRSWLACVVPVFEAGRRAGLGEALGMDLGAAWDAASSTEIRLPVYHSWRFGTGEQGTFESLVRRLRPRELPASVGRRDLDLGDPGGGLPAVPGVVVSYEGGLVSPVGGPEPWPDEPRTAMKAGLRRTLNAQVARADTPLPYDALRDDPVIGPPAYAAGQAGRRRIPAEGEEPDWFEQLNTEPHRRAVAGLGAEVVRNDQEALMAAAWEHAAGLREVNRTLTGARIAWEVARTADPAFASLDDATIVQLARPAMGRLAHPDGGTVRGAVAASALPAGLVSGAFRRASRTVRAFTATTRLPGGGTLRVGSTDALTRAVLSDPVGFVGGWGDAYPPLGAEVDKPPPDELQAPVTPVSSARRRRRATADDPRVAQRIAVTAYDFPRPEVDLDHAIGYGGATQPVADVADAVRSGLDQAGTVVSMIEARVVGLPADRSHDVPAGLGAHPRFTTPMSQRLLALSAEYLVPGIGRVPDGTLGLLAVNREFLEAFLAGLNHELGREFVWREYPATTGATWAQHFWDSGPGGAPDIAPIGAWAATSAIGAHPPRDIPATADLVLLIKGALPRRFPDLRVYAVEAEWAEGRRREKVGGEVAAPLFTGRLASDAYFYGFALTERRARGSTDPARPPGWFFVLEEQPRASRFGLDVPQGRFRATAPRTWSALSWAHLVGVDDELPLFVDTSGPEWLVDAGQLPGNGPPGEKDAWGTGSASMARITFQRPVRMLVHADAMLPAP
jgi:hypothetical protein